MTLREVRFRLSSVRDLRSDDRFVPTDLVRIDLPIVVDVEGREESLGVLLHLLESEIAIVIPVGLLEPHLQGIPSTFGAERLAHRTDEKPPPVPRWGGRGLKGRRLGGGKKEQHGDGHRTQFPGGRGWPIRGSTWSSCRLGGFPVTTGFSASSSCNVSRPSCFLSSS